MAFRPVDILIADGATTRIGKAVADALRRRGLRCEAIDDSPVARDDPGYLRLLEATLQETQPKVLMPIFRGELIAGHGSMVPPTTVLTCGDASAMHLLDGKVSASALCAELGIPQPRLYTDSEAEGIASWPVVFKRSTGLGGDSVYFPKDGKALANLIRSCAGKPHLVMDYVDGYDVSVDAIRWDGYFQAAAYRTMVPKRKGTSLVRIGVDAPELISHARTILDATGYRGVCGIDFRVDGKTGKAYFLECNPRFSGGLKSSLTAGFDIPGILWQLSQGETPAQVRIRTGRISVEWKEIREIVRKKML